MRLERSRIEALEQGLPPALRPVLRAYLLGYASSTAPRLLTLLLTYLSSKRRARKQKQKQQQDAACAEQLPEDYLQSFLRILRGGTELQRFPTFCAALVGGSTLLQKPLQILLERVWAQLGLTGQLRLSRWLSTFIAAWFSLKVLQSKKSNPFIDEVQVETVNGIERRPVQFAGRTMDLTLFAITRALDVIIGELWSRRKARRTGTGEWNIIEKSISRLADPAIFASSSALIMWAWIYTPDRLPSSYNKWIKSAAAVDHRLLLALRRMRYGEIKYGLETGQAHLLQRMCEELNLPADYGDPVKSIPFPCELVHMGTGPSCEYHLVSRFARSFLWAFSTYLPLNVLLKLRNPSAKGLKRALLSSARSSAFLGSFIALYYYGICLARTRVGPRLLGTSAPACQQIDSGVCVACGCTLCGWSVMLENSSRQEELGLFVAPRALATLLPRRYRWEKQERETLAFAVSAAVVFTCVLEKPQRVRGVLGRLLGRVLGE